MLFFKIKNFVLFFLILIVVNLDARIWTTEEAGVGNISVVNIGGVSTKNPAFVLRNKFEVGTEVNYFTSGVNFGNINNMNLKVGYKINNISKTGVIINYISVDALSDTVNNFIGRFIYNYNIHNFILGVSANIEYEISDINNDLNRVFNGGGSLGALYVGIKNFKVGVTIDDINLKNSDYLIDKLDAGGIYDISNLSILGEIGSFKEKITGKLGVVLRYLNNRFKIRSGINIGGSAVFRVNGIGAGFSYRIYNFDVIYSGYYIFNLGSYGIHSIGICYFYNM